MKEETLDKANELFEQLLEMRVDLDIFEAERIDGGAVAIKCCGVELGFHDEENCQYMYAATVKAIKQRQANLQKQFDKL